MAVQDIWTAGKDFADDEVVTHTHLNQQVRDNIEVLRLMLEGDGSTQKIHSLKAGTLVNRPTPGTAGREYYCTDLGLKLIDTGTEWAPLLGSHNPHQCAYFGSDFIGVITDADSERQNGWSVYLSNSGALHGYSDDDSVWEMATGTTANSVVSVRNRSTQTALDPERVFLMSTRWKHLDPTAGTQVMYSGLFSNNADSPTNAIYTRKDGSGNVYGTVRSGSSDQGTADLGIDGSAMATYIVEFDGADVKIYLNTWNAAGLKLTTSTSLPTAGMLFGFRESITTSPPTSREVLIDHGHIWIAKS